MAVVGTFITTLIAVTVVIACLFLSRKHRRKNGELMEGEIHLPMSALIVSALLRQSIASEPQ